jgi:hypothetical protein
MWNSDNGDTPDRNLYGTHPVYYDTRYFETGSDGSSKYVPWTDASQGGNYSSMSTTHCNISFSTNYGSHTNSYTSPRGILPQRTRTRDTSQARDDHLANSRRQHRSVLLLWSHGRTSRTTVPDFNDWFACDAAVLDFWLSSMSVGLQQLVGNRICRKEHGGGQDTTRGMCDEYHDPGAFPNLELGPVE